MLWEALCNERELQGEGTGEPGGPVKQTRRSVNEMLEHALRKQALQQQRDSSPEGLHGAALRLDIMHRRGLLRRAAGVEDEEMEIAVEMLEDVLDEMLAVLPDSHWDRVPIVITPGGSDEVEVGDGLLRVRFDASYEELVTALAVHAENLVARHKVLQAEHARTAQKLVEARDSLCCAGVEVEAPLHKALIALRTLSKDGINLQLQGLGSLTVVIGDAFAVEATKLHVPWGLRPGALAAFLNAGARERFHTTVEEAKQKTHNAAMAAVELEAVLGCRNVHFTRGISPARCLEAIEELLAVSTELAEALDWSEVEILEVSHVYNIDEVDGEMRVSIPFSVNAEDLQDFIEQLRHFEAMQDAVSRGPRTTHLRRRSARGKWYHKTPSRVG